MANLKKTVKGLMATLLALAMTVALGVSMFASAADTVTETVVLQQTIVKGTLPQQTSYTYLLTPENAENPLPQELKDQAPSDGKYKVGTIHGSSTDKTALTMTFEIDKTHPGVYVYYLEKTPETPSGDTFSPETWKFGFRVTTDEKTGTLVVFPEVCVGGDSELSDYDENGYPTRLTLKNAIKGKTTTTAKAQTTKTATNGKTTTNSSVRARWVNTGDESRLILWVMVLSVSIGGLIFLLLVRRSRDDDEENN